MDTALSKVMLCFLDRGMWVDHDSLVAVPEDIPPFICHEFRVPPCFLPSSERIYSSSFEFLGHKWCVYPQQRIDCKHRRCFDGDLACRKAMVHPRGLNNPMYVAAFVQVVDVAENELLPMEFKMEIINSRKAPRFSSESVVSYRCRKHI